MWNVLRTVVTKLGVGLQMLFWFCLVSIGVFSHGGKDPEQALLMGGAVVVIFWFGWQMGKEAAKQEAQQQGKAGRV